MKSKLYHISLSLVALMMFLVIAGPASVQAMIIQPQLNYLEVIPATQTINVGETAQYQAIYHNGKTTSDVTNACAWYINDSNIATITADGAYKGTNAGTTTVYAFYREMKATSNNAELIVNQPQASGPKLIIEPLTASIYVGESQQYRAYLRYPTGAPDTDVTEQCTWGIEDPIANLTAVKGEYLGVTPGATNVTAHYVRQSSPYATVYIPPLDLTAEARLKVSEKEPEVKITLEVTPPTASIMVGDSQKYIATLHYSDGSPDQNVTELAIWTLSKNIADATGKGKYKGTNKGTATVTATYTPLVLQIPDGLKKVPVTRANSLSDDAILIVDEFGPPPTEQLPDGKMIDRQPGYITLVAPQDLGTPAEEFTMSYDASKMDGNPNRHPKVFYWNTNYQKWVALASYPTTPGTIKAINDGHYSGWFVVMGCIQPSFTDTNGHWAEKIANRMNGLGLLEGYPSASNPSSLVRPAGLTRIITRAELTAAVARILGLAPGDTHLYPTISFMSAPENDQILNARYSDANLIAEWARPYIAAMTKAGLVSGKGTYFAPSDQLTRIEAAVIISNALKDVPGFGTPADLSAYADYSQVPSWANGKVAQGTINGYPDGTLRPNQPISRAETLTLLLTLLRGLGW